MQPPGERGPVPRRTLEAEFPIPLNSDEFLYLPGPANAPILHQSVRWRSSPWGQDVKCQLYYTGKNREIFYRWAQEHRQREKEALPHGKLPPQKIWPHSAGAMATSWMEKAQATGQDLSYAQHLRETAWYDPTMPAQYLQTSPRWGAFQWRDRPIPPKEFVLNRHRFGAIEPGTTHTEFK